jgi:hypothetical protein
MWTPARAVCKKYCWQSWRPVKQQQQLGGEQQQQEQQQQQQQQ